MIRTMRSNCCRSEPEIAMLKEYMHTMSIKTTHDDIRLDVSQDIAYSGEKENICDGEMQLC